MRTLIVLLSVIFVLFVPGHSEARVIERVSVASDGTEADNGSRFPVMSVDGRFVAFVSAASNLVPNDTNNADDVFVHDRVTGETTRVSVAIDGTECDLGSSRLDTRIALSPDGRFVAFDSPSTNLVLGDRNGETDIFVHDRRTGRTTLVSLSSDGAQGNNDSFDPVLSADGRLVLFTSRADNLIGMDRDGDDRCDPPGCDFNNAADVFLHDRTTGQTTPIIIGLDGNTANSNTDSAALSANGRVAAFSTGATNFLPGIMQGGLFTRDLATGNIAPVSLFIDVPVQVLGNPSLNADGRLVVFHSTNPLVPEDTNNRLDVFVYNLVSGETTRVSVASDGTEGDDFSRFPVLSADGRFVVFESRASSLVPNDINTVSDIFVHDRLTRRTIRVSVTNTGEQGFQGTSGRPTISGDGRLVALGSNHAIFVPDDTNNTDDVFVATLNVVQPIQAVFNRLPRTGNRSGFSLVAGKDLVVRAFLGTPLDTPAAAAEGELCVDGAVETCPAANLIRTQGMVLPFGTQFADDDRRAANNSLNFFITGEQANTLLTSGGHSFALRVRPVVADAFAEMTDSFEAGFRHSDSFTAVVFPIAVRGDVGPDAALLSDAADFLRAAYPVDEERVFHRLQPRQRQPLLPPLDEDLLNVARLRLVLVLERQRQVLSMRRRQGLFPDPAFRADHIVAIGVLPNFAAGRNPLSVPGGMAIAGYTIPTPGLDNVIVTLDRVPAPAPDNTVLIGSTTAHEVGHLLGFGEEYCPELDNEGAALDFPCPSDSRGRDNLPRFFLTNPPPQSAQAGDRLGNFVTEEMGAFDVSQFMTNRRALFGPPGDPVYGYMGSGDDTSWTTQVNYEFLYNCCTDPEPARQNQVVAQQELREVVVLCGTITTDGAITLEPVLIDTTDQPLSRPAGSTVMVELRDATGAVLDSVGFDPRFEIELLGETPQILTTESTPFCLTTDLPPATASAVFLQDATPVAAVTRSAMPPTVTVTTAMVTEDSLDITWSGADADNDGLTFTVLYSPDQVTFQLLALDTTETTLTIPLAELMEPQAGAFIEVRVNDGFNSTTAETSLVCQLVGTVTGDVNGDGIISPADARRVMQQFLASGTPSSLTLCQQAQGDVQQDGNLTPADSVCLLQIFLGLPSCRDF